MRLHRLCPVALLAACVAGPAWSRIPKSDVPPMSERDQVQVWSHGRSRQFHSLRVTGDSISGVPYFKDPRCDSCRVSLARAEVDSVRISAPGMGSATGGTLAGMAIGFTILVVVLFYAMAGLEI